MTALLPELEEMLDDLFDRGGSDLILSVGAPPTMRVDGELAPYGDAHLTAAQTEQLAASLLLPEQRVSLASVNQVDFSMQWGEYGRVRGNAFRQRGSIAIALRAIPSHIPSFSELLLPEAVSELVNMPHGLVLFTGPTGAGKSTTQASLIDHINNTRQRHIITLEDPIEYLHTNKLAVIDQREIGVDAPSFAAALRSTLREDPDVVLVGELRDLESIAIGLTVAETGHLVFGTLHSNDAGQAIHRVVDVFPSAQQQQIRVQLSSVLLAVVHQELLPRIDGGRVAAFEVLLATPAVRNLIRDNKIGQLRNVMLTSSEGGMCTLESALSWLVRSGFVSEQEALARAMFPQEVTAHTAPYTPQAAPEELAPPLELLPVADSDVPDPSAPPMFGPPLEPGARSGARRGRLFSKAPFTRPGQDA